MLLPWSSQPLTSCSLTLCCSFSKSIKCYLEFLFGCFCSDCPFSMDGKLFRCAGNTSHLGGSVTQWFREWILEINCLGSNASITTIQPGQARVCSLADNPQGCRGLTQCFLLILNVPLRLTGGLWSSRLLRNLGSIPIPTSVITRPEQREHGGLNSGC